MTDSELKGLFEAANCRFLELMQKHEAGFSLTRSECLELRSCNERLRIVAVELWLRAGKPSGEEFDLLRRPSPKRPLPRSTQGDYTTTEQEH